VEVGVKTEELIAELEALQRDVTAHGDSLAACELFMGKCPDILLALQHYKSAERDNDSLSKKLDAAEARVQRLREVLTDMTYSAAKALAETEESQDGQSTHGQSRARD